MDRKASLRDCDNSRESSGRTSGGSSGHSRQPLTVEAGEAVLPAADISVSSSDGNTEIACPSTRNRKRRACRRDSDRSSDGSRRSPKPKRKCVKRLHRYAKSGSTVADSLLQTPEAEIHNSLSTGGRSYALESEDRCAADETEGVSAEEPTPNFISESGGNPDWEISQAAERSQEMYNSCRQPGESSTTEEREVRSEEVDTSCGEAGDAFTAEKTVGSSDQEGNSSRQPCAASTAEVGGAAPPSTSPDPVLPAAGKEGSISDGNSEKCPICLVAFGAYEVGTPDTCDHFFCTRCLEEWSAIDNTCPVDRQEFDVILARTYPSREINRLIPLRSQELQNEHEDVFLQDVVFCVMCGGSDREERMISCHGCFVSYHVECLVPPPDTGTFEEWFCPMCVVTSSSLEIF